MEFESHVRRMPWQIGESPHEHSAEWPPTEEDARARALKAGGMKGKLRGKDKMNGEASKIKGQLMKWMREDEQAKAWAAIHAILMSFVCLGFFLTITLTWFKVYHNSFGWSVFIFICSIIAASLIAVFGYKKKEQRTWILIMGFLCMFMIMVGLIWGFFMYYRHLVYYQKYQEMRSYSNVGGSQTTQQFNDGSMFLFTQDTRLDVMRSVGFRSRWTGQTYCVAPVVDSTMTAANPINFWAVGPNCCLARGEFACGDAADSQTMSALVVLEPEDVVRPFMKWAVAGSVYPRYINALHLQESAFATRASKNIKLLYWVKDPIAKMDSFYLVAKFDTIWFSVALWIVLLFSSYVICYKWRWVRPRADKRLQGPAEQKPAGQAATG